MPLFRHDWFSNNTKKNFEAYLEKFKGKPNLRFLEIGSFEGMSTLWLLENILTDSSCRITCIDTFEGSEEHRLMGIDTNNLFDIFNNNISKYKDKVIVLRGKSQEQLRKEEFRHPIYDFIYIDGSHRAPDVLEDTILSFRLLKPNGIMIFDDYQWKFPVNDETESPKIALDSFLSIFRKEYKLLSKDYQIVIEKLSDDSRNKKTLGIGYYINEIANRRMTLENVLTSIERPHIINIITPCYRIQNLSKIFNSITSSLMFNRVDVKWYIIFDGKKVAQTPNWLNNHKFIITDMCNKDGISGNQLRNRALDMINNDNDNNGWVYFLDDDNLLHPEYLAKINYIIDNNPNIEGILTSQQLPGSIRLANKVDIGFIDTSQFTLKRKLIGNTRWREDVYEADGIFIKELYDRNKEKFITIDDILCYYNKIEDENVVIKKDVKKLLYILDKI